jgi:hypothetical protein
MQPGIDFGHDFGLRLIPYRARWALCSGIISFLSRSGINRVNVFLGVFGAK